MEKEFLIPNYYSSFKCKMGKCRVSCCEGWPVTLSLKDYFKLVSKECSLELREKIDKGVKVNLHPTPEAYAQITHDFFGNCPLRLKDGRCAIHSEIGEEGLAEVCRLYPRGIRNTPSNECSCSNSCEAVIELLLSMDEPITFLKKDLNFEGISNKTRKNYFNTHEKELEIRLFLIKIIQNRNISLSNRLINLGFALKDLETVLEENDINKIEEFLLKTYCKNFDEFVVDEKHLLDAIISMEKMIKMIDEKSNSIRMYGEISLNYFNDENKLLDLYNYSKKSFESKNDKWEIWFEHMLVNHMFFEQFPFQDRKENPWEEFMAISSLYALLRFLSIGCFSYKQNLDNFVDMCAAIFRLVEHSSFDKYSLYVLKEINCDTPQKIFDLLRL